jgi:PAS domain S-box-containing protein
MKKNLIFLLWLILMLPLSLLSEGNTAGPDSLFNVMKNSKHDSDRVNTLIKIGQYYHNTLPDSAVVYYNKALRISQKTDYKKGTARASSFLGYITEDRGNYKQAINYYTQSLTLYKELNNQKEVANHYNFIGLAYNYKGDYVKAIENFQASIKIYEQQGDSSNISKCLLNMGLAFYNNTDYLKAEEYFKKAVTIKEKIKDINGLAICYLNLGNLLTLKKSYKGSLDYYTRSAAIFEKNNQLLYLAYCQVNIGNIYMEKGEYEAAQKYFQLAGINCKVVNDQNLLILIDINLSQIYSKTNRFELAVTTAINSVNMADSLGILPSVKDGYFMLSKIYKDYNDYKNALKYYELGAAVRDSIFSIDQSSHFQELSAKYESEQKENQIKIQQAKISASEAEIEKAQTQKWALILTIIMILSVAGVILYSFIRNKKTTRLLREKNAEIEQQKAEIMVIADNLEYVNHELEKLSIVASETDNAVIIASPEGEIEWVNEGFRRMFGYELAEFKMKYGTNLQTGSENVQIKELIEQSILSRQPITYSTENKTKAGKTIWTHTTLTPITKNNEIQKLIAIDTDITRLKEAESEIQKQKQELKKRNEQITENIVYAQKIQSALLPPFSDIQQYFPDSFLIYRPRDIVSGDFYWFYRKGGTYFISVSDCTGHGVSGAFMSMIGSVTLTEIVVHKGIHSPVEVITELDRNVRYALNKNKAGSDDGMDISFCSIDTEKGLIHYASANQSLCLCDRNNNLSVYDGDLWSVGGSLGVNKEFLEQTLPLTEVKMIYLGSDGFADQFGGESGQKFMSKKLQHIIGTSQFLSMQEQKIKLESELDLWMNIPAIPKTYPQTDDICLIGINLQSVKG